MLPEQRDLLGCRRRWRAVELGREGRRNELAQERHAVEERSVPHGDRDHGAQTRVAIGLGGAIERLGLGAHHQEIVLDRRDPTPDRFDRADHGPKVMLALGEPLPADRRIGVDQRQLDRQVVVGTLLEALVGMHVRVDQAPAVLSAAARRSPRSRAPAPGQAPRRPGRPRRFGRLRSGRRPDRTRDLRHRRSRRDRAASSTSAASAPATRLHHDLTTTTKHLSGTILRGRHAPAPTPLLPGRPHDAAKRSRLSRVTRHGHTWTGPNRCRTASSRTLPTGVPSPDRASATARRPKNSIAAEPASPPNRVQSNRASASVTRRRNSHFVRPPPPPAWAAAMPAVESGRAVRAGRRTNSYDCGRCARSIMDNLPQKQRLPTVRTGRLEAAGLQIHRLPRPSLNAASDVTRRRGEGRR